MKKVYDLAARDSGTWEWAEGHNPKVVQYFADVGHSWVKDDETAWCAAFVGAMLKRAGLPHTGALNARSYLDWGTPVGIEQAERGDVVILWRGDRDGWQGHVAFFHSLTGDRVTLLGGNQSNQVNLAAYPLDRVLGVRRMAKPPREKLTQTRSAKGAATAGAGLVGSEAMDRLSEAAQNGAAQLEPLAQGSDMLQWAFVALTVLGIGVVLYARWDDIQKGLR